MLETDVITGFTAPVLGAMTVCGAQKEVAVTIDDPHRSLLIFLLILYDTSR